MKEIQKLTWQQLESAYPPSNFSFKTTDDLEPLDEIIGQERAKKAIEFGLCTQAQGYNIYMSGEPGTGKSSVAKMYAQKKANQAQRASDWCYVYNFKEERNPKALCFDAGDGRRFKDDMTELIAYLTKEIPYIYSTKEYEKKKEVYIEDLEYQMGLESTGYYIKALKERYLNYEGVLAYLEDLQQDILDHIEIFIGGKEREDDIKKLVRKYDVNLLIDHSKSAAAPVIISCNPVYNKIIGELEYHNELGFLSTDYMNIKPGLLHQANGGYLILQAEELVTNHQVWNAIKQVLKTKQLYIENPQGISVTTVASLKPEPIPISVKVILIGSLNIYYLLYEGDQDFKKLFKVRADFDREMPGTEHNIKLVARFIKTFSKEQLLLPFSAGAIKDVLRYAIRHAGNQKKITTEFSWISHIIIEANTFASLQGSKVVGQEHVQLAAEEKRYRIGRYAEKLEEQIIENTIMIQTTGSCVGQINALAVQGDGEYRFGRPIKITATTYKGARGVINIEKEARLSGSIHTKGTQVIEGYLGQIYGQKFPLSITSRICFEQNYSKIDGDSASSAELYSIISSLSGIPIKQNLAVTGSINQHGIIQPVGGVINKIEGFFEICEKRGLTGDQGVIIPKQNIQNLVLNNKVIEAIKNEVFHIYAISTVEDGLKLLTGKSYEEIKQKVEIKLKGFNSSQTQD